MLVNGKWTAEWHPVQAKDEKGGFVRQTSSFRNWVTPAGSAGPTGEGGFAAEAGRYHLYVALICPWASRTLIGRKLKKLDDVISVSVVEPALTDQGWRFGDYPGSDRDELNRATYLHEIYTRADSAFTGRATVPVLWDKQRGTIVSNESADIAVSIDIDGSVQPPERNSWVQGPVPEVVGAPKAAFSQKPKASASIGTTTSPSAVGRVPAGEIEGAVIDQLRAVFRQPEIVAGTWKAARAYAEDISEADARAALQQLDPLWDELFPAEQARIVTLLVERVDIGTNGLNFRLRMDGLGGLAREMLSGSIGAAA